jgi:predicted house-cleaning noncanonical NTP pyrophosphatase (MazG superfamily)
MAKLIRDGYAEILKPDDWRQIRSGSPEHFEFLEDKVLEELTELKESDFLDVSEYGDLLEVIQSMAELKGIPWNLVVASNVEKSVSRGRFIDGIILLD